MKIANNSIFDTSNKINVKGNDFQFAHNLVGAIPFANSRFSCDVTPATLVYRTIEVLHGSHIGFKADRLQMTVVAKWQDN